MMSEPMDGTTKRATGSRFDYIKYDEIAQTQQNTAKQLVQGIEAFVNSFGNTRSASLALTKLEETYMWVGKLIRDQQIARSVNVKPVELQEERTPS